MLCNECLRRNECKKLCEDAEEYTNQDAPNYHKPDETHFTPKEKMVLRALSVCKNRKQMSKILGLSIRSIECHVSRLKKKALNIVL